MTLPVAFIEGIGGPELMMIMFIILLLFGANRLPDLAKGLGRSVREFKKAASGVEEEVRRVMEEHDEPESPKKLPSYSGTIPAGGAAAATPPPAALPPAPPSPPAAGGEPQS
ncbi:MAG TPA: twin-arginine translocase TatA/TatE family subunit [Lacunisphaera sp.]|nr:twin-arginine translocase TatA/TatE family subunit [Lacunisphaera sp.]